MKLKCDAKHNPTLSSLIEVLSEYEKKYGDMPVNFFSYEWTEDLEEMKYQKRYLYKGGIRKTNTGLRIAVDH